MKKPTSNCGKHKQHPCGPRNCSKKRPSKLIATSRMLTKKNTIAAGKAKDQEHAAQLAQAGEKFDDDVRAAREAAICGTTPAFLAPSAPELAVDPAQAMQIADSPARATAFTRIGSATGVFRGNLVRPTGMLRRGCCRPNHQSGHSNPGQVPEAYRQGHPPQENHIIHLSELGGGS